MHAVPCEYRKSPTHSRSFLRALQRRCSTGGCTRPRADRFIFEAVPRFGCDDAAAAAAGVGEVSDVTEDALS